MPREAARHALLSLPEGHGLSSDFGSRLPLSRAELDRDHLSRVAGIDALLADPAARAIVLHGGKALMVGDAALALLSPTSVDHELALYLGRATVDAPDLAAGAPVLALVIGDAAAAALPGDPAPTWGDLRRLGAELSTRDAGLFTEALGLANWHAAYGFSPVTGRATEVAASGWTRVDTETGRESFPRTDAAIIVGITDADDRLLLGSNAMWESNRFSLLAGFVEPGESLEQAVVREVFEESGLHVVDPIYLGSQPWPFPASLMLGFRAHVPAEHPTAGTPDGEEILEVRWFSREELAALAADGSIILPGPTSIARQIIDDWFGGEIIDGGRW
ncbi:NAD(+) diphosphatase [soil metagenome]